MERRVFVKNAAIGLAGAAAWVDWSCRPDRGGGPWLDQLIKANDDHIPTILGSQVHDALSPLLGAVPDPFLINHPGSSAGLVQTFACAYVSPGSQYYRDGKLLAAMSLAMIYLRRVQHEDGTIDLLTTNFHSTPDTAFVAEPLAISYKLLSRDADEKSKELQSQIQDFLIKAGRALSVGGIHTPNHRWVVCMALARLNELFPDPVYTNRVDAWLAEGIDIDADGQYTERSTAVYSPLTDRCLITIARLLNKEDLFEPVRKNLDMTLYYLHPNGEIVTETSRRQDQYQARKASSYHYPYLFMCLKDKNEAFGAMTQSIEKENGPKGMTGSLPYYLEDAHLLSACPAGSLPAEYEKQFEASGLVRWRKWDMDVSLLAQNSTLFTLHNKDAVLQAVRIASAFFGKGQFIPEKLEKTQAGYRLTQKLEGPYYQPFPVDSLPGDGNWEKMPRDKRPKSEIQYMEYILDAHQEGDAWYLDFDLHGTDHVPVALELNFRSGGKFTGVEPVPGVEDVFFLKGSNGKYAMKGSNIFFGPGKQEHAWTQLRGAEPKIPGQSVYITGYTPFRYQLKIYS